MGLYNFKARFVPKIEDGSKRHTIRGRRRYEDKPGDTMHLFYGARTKQCRLLMRAPCVKVDRIQITSIAGKFDVFIGDSLLENDECERLAVADGFDSFAEMMGFWDGRLPFKGKIYHWNPEARR
jgi:hypothetical protein